MSSNVASIAETFSLFLFEIFMLLQISTRIFWHVMGIVYVPTKEGINPKGRVLLS